MKYNNDQNTHNNAHKIPNKRTLTLEIQNALTHSQRVAQTERAERIAKTKPTDKPAPTAQPRQTTPPITPQPPTLVPLSSLEDNTLQDITSPEFVAQGGQYVHFMHKNDQWQASVREQIGVFSCVEVPPACEHHGDVAVALRALQGKPEWYVQQRIHAMTARQVPYVPKFVYLGEQRLKGGGDPEPSGVLVRYCPMLWAGYFLHWWGMRQAIAREYIHSNLSVSLTQPSDRLLVPW